jgi:hypothetical protein
VRVATAAGFIDLTQMSSLSLVDHDAGNGVLKTCQKAVQGHGLALFDAVRNKGIGLRNREIMDVKLDKYKFLIELARDRDKAASSRDSKNRVFDLCCKKERQRDTWLEQIITFSS